MPSQIPAPIDNITPDYASNVDNELMHTKAVHDAIQAAIDAVFSGSISGNTFNNTYNINNTLRNEKLTTSKTAIPNTRYFSISAFEITLPGVNSTYTHPTSGATTTVALGDVVEVCQMASTGGVLDTTGKQEFVDGSVKPRIQSYMVCADPTNIDNKIWYRTATITAGT